MANLNDIYIRDLLADATYVDWDIEGDPKDYCKALATRMTPTIADFFLENFTVVEQYRSIKEPGLLKSGFDATIFKDNSGKIFVAMRGTYGGSDLLSDFKLALSGNAGKQLADMVNWWSKITTPLGESAQQIFSVPIGPFEFARGSAVSGTGKISLDELNSGTMEVVGHSLGGYLASAFNRLFNKQAHIQHETTFNSAGFTRMLGGKQFTYLERLVGRELGMGRFPNESEHDNFYAMHGINVTTNSSYFFQTGKRLELFNEYSNPYFLSVPNHFMYKLTDALALGNAVGQLDSSYRSN